MKSIHIITLLAILQAISLNFAGAFHLLETSHDSGEGIHVHLHDHSVSFDAQNEHDDQAHSHIQFSDLISSIPLVVLNPTNLWTEDGVSRFLSELYKPPVPPPTFLV